MLNCLPVMLGVGAVLGFLSGLGVGGGSLLMLWLTLVLGLEHSIARNINLLFFLPAAAIASFFRWKQGALEWKKVLPAVIAGCISAAIFAWLSRHIDIALIKKLFGFLLLVTGVRELFYRARKAK
ncbi:MAG: sulfite exporter TauE/SafE family protein [Oscillospiraceae bacterium]|nr:sulfite exporter TauE/SafE family protein [Oscillospiraceae bacterium]